MGFRGQAFAFDSPAAAIAGMIARLGDPPADRPRETVGLEDAAGRILAEDVRADRDSPAFDHSAMDGYAVYAADLLAAARAAGPSETIAVPVVGESRIGTEPPALPNGSRGAVAVRIATGAPIPPGSDAVVRREDVAENAACARGGTTSIGVAPSIAARVKPGDHIRRRGENARAGEAVLAAGGVLSAAAVGTLAAVGVSHPRVLAPLRVAVIVTGDELVDSGGSPAAFQVRNSNGPSVGAALASERWTEVVRVIRVGDDGQLDGVLKEACTEADAVVLTGGVSMGHRDPVRPSVERLGAEVVFHGLPQRPGKPMLGAVLRRASDARARSVPVFGLPGNPVSALVTCVRIVLPVLAACAGAKRTPFSCIPRFVELSSPGGRTLDLWWHRLVRLAPGPAGLPRAELVDGRGSGDIVAAGMSDGFVEVRPAGTAAAVPFYAWPGS